MQQVRGGLVVATAELALGAVTKPRFEKLGVGPAGLRQEIPKEASLLGISIFQGAAHDLSINVFDPPQCIPVRAMCATRALTAISSKDFLTHC